MFETIPTPDEIASGLKTMDVKDKSGFFASIDRIAQGEPLDGSSGNIFTEDRDEAGYLKASFHASKSTFKLLNAHFDEFKAAYEARGTKHPHIQFSNLGLFDEAEADPLFAWESSMLLTKLTEFMNVMEIDTLSLLLEEGTALVILSELESIRKVVIKTDVLTSSVLEFFTDQLRTCPSLQSFEFLISSPPGVRPHWSIAVPGWSYDIAGWNAFANAASEHKNLRELRFERVDFKSLEEGMPAFPGIESLSFRECRIPSSESDDWLSQSQDLARLVFMNCKYRGDFTNLLLRILYHPNLEDVSLECPSDVCIRQSSHSSSSLHGFDTKPLKLDLYGLEDKVLPFNLRHVLGILAKRGGVKELNIKADYRNIVAYSFTLVVKYLQGKAAPEKVNPEFLEAFVHYGKHSMEILLKLDIPADALDCITYKYAREDFQSQIKESVESFTIDPNRQMALSILSSTGTPHYKEFEIAVKFDLLRENPEILLACMEPQKRGRKRKITE